MIKEEKQKGKHGKKRGKGKKEFCSQRKTEMHAN